MDQVPRDGFLEYSPGVIQFVRKQYGLDNPEVFNESINTLQNWINKQDHFVRKDFQRKHLEWALVTCKGSIERAKERLDSYCTAKSLHQKMYLQLDMKITFYNLCQFVNGALLPKYADDFYRVGICKFLKLPPNWNSVLDIFRVVINFCEYIRNRDYLNGMILIIDYSNVNIFELMKMASIVDLRHFVSVALDCYGMRIKGMHVISTSNAFDVMIAMLKQFASPKLSSRLVLHKNYETLHDYIPIDVLPKDYGGKERPLSEINDEWVQILSSEDQIKLAKEMQEFRTEESRRHLIDFNNQYLGTPGSFRQFVVD